MREAWLLLCENWEMCAVAALVGIIIGVL